MLTALGMLYSALDNIKLAADIRAKGDMIFHGTITYSEQGTSMLFFHAYYGFFAALATFIAIYSPKRLNQVTPRTDLVDPVALATGGEED